MIFSSERPSRSWQGLRLRDQRQQSRPASFKKQVAADIPLNTVNSSQDGSETEGLYDTILSQAWLKASSIERVVLASDYQVSALEQMLLDFRGDPTYHAFDIPNPVNFNRLALSCVEIVNHHPLLRSVFVCHEHQVYQVTMKSSFII